MDTRAYYCAECDWFNQIHGSSGIGGNKSVQWHLNQWHTVFELPSNINLKAWSKKHMLQKLYAMLEGRQLTPLEKPDDDDSEGLQPSETCIHDWKFQYVDVLRQLKTSQKELIRSECKGCGTARVQGPADKVREVWEGPGKIVIDGHCDIVANGKIEVVVKKGKVNIVAESEFTALVVEAGECNFEADVTLQTLDVLEDASADGGSNTITISDTLTSGGTINV